MATIPSLRCAGNTNVHAPEVAVPESGIGQRQHHLP